jgi:hypothetical protein
MTVSTLVPGIYNSTPPTLDDGEQVQLQMDASGNLKATLATGSNVIGTVAIDQTTFGTTNAVYIAGVNGGIKDSGPAWTTVFGVSGARYTSADRSGSAASVTDAPTSGQKLVITDCLISVDTAMRVDLKEQTSGTVLASVYLPANGTYQFTPRSRLKLATADRTLQVQTSAAGNIAVTAFYYSEA